MRLLPTSTSTVIMAAVQTFFQNPSNHPFIFTPHNARIIAGSEEQAGFQWLAVNYATGYLNGSKHF